MAELRVGTSGWHYEHWAGLFYPAELPRTRWFEHYATCFDTVELNNTFYRLPGPAAFEAWRAQAPPGFLYAVKFSRYGTHMRKLLEPTEPIARFLSGAERLGAALGPVLVHLPPRWKVNTPRLDEFLAAATATGHRWAVELRDSSWLCPEVYAVLRRHGAALCQHDLLDGHPAELTADWVYLRYHGRTAAGPCSGCYSRPQLRAQARRLRKLLDAGLDVYAYFNNDVGGHAPANAADLLRTLRE